jgi:hypothetical protein
MTATSCRVCGGTSEHYESLEVLGRFEARYMRCKACGYIAASEPTWLEMAYSSAITRLDLGLLSRASFLATVIESILRLEHIGGGRFLDWAGGYGVLTRMMRDRGFDYWHHDPLCDNIFAADFVADPSGTFDMVSAVEVLEHLTDPVTQLESLASSTDRLMLTTHLVGDPPPQLKSWWYAAPETGQHIGFFTAAALTQLANKLGYRAYIGSSGLHLFARGPVGVRTRAVLRRPRLARPLSRTTVNPPSRILLEADYDYVVGRLRSESR